MARVRLVALLLGLALVAGGCTAVGAPAGAESRTMTAHFSRAIQIFPGNSVRVLGVTVGRVIDVQNVPGAAEVTFRIDDPEIKLPADVHATIVPISLLGERYVQLLPAYDSGPEFRSHHIGLERTSVPAEQDELLRSMQDYFGALDPEKVRDFVTNAATILEDNGESLNRLIEHGSRVFETLANKRDSLAGLIQELDTLTTALSTRQDSLGRVIRSYNAVGHALNDNRAALEGTIQGLSRASAELAALLIEHRDPLGEDVETLTRSFRTLSRNADRFARTGRWAVRLFTAAERAVDWEAHWLRLGNQGAPLFELLAFRLEDRLIGVCLRLGIDECSNRGYWQEHFPDMFCFVEGRCGGAGSRRSPGRALDDALDELPGELRAEIGRDLGIPKKNCKKAKNPERCRKKKKKLTEGDALDQILDDILDDAASLTGSAGGQL